MLKDKYLETIGFMAVVTSVIPRINVVIPLKMGSRLIQHLTQLTKRNIGHFLVVVM